MTAITVTVAAEHIARGQAHNCSRCPIALAIRDAIPQVISAEVYQIGCTLLRYGDGHFTHVDLPPEAMEFIAAFDWGDGGKPFTFEAEMVVAS